MEPTPVAIEDNALSLGRATAGGASRHGERGVLLSSECASLLSTDSRAEGKGTEGKGKGGHLSGCSKDLDCFFCWMMSESDQWHICHYIVQCPYSRALEGPLH